MSMQENVDRGAALLDNLNPSWAKAMNLDILNMNKCDYCVLGQCFGHYDLGLKWLRSQGVELKFGDDMYGFFTHEEEEDGSDSWAKLKDMWFIKIRERQVHPEHFSGKPLEV
jgi:hypothetical protein